MSALPEAYSWWESLKHGGVLVSPSKLPSFFPDETSWLPTYQQEQLRSEVARVLDQDASRVGPLLDLVLERICGFPHHEWTKGPNVDLSWGEKVITGEVVKPRRVWEGEHGATLPVFIADHSLGIKQKDWMSVRLGIGRGKRAVSKVVEWLRRADEKLALVTNGRQWRLVFAGADFDAWAEWDIDLWFSEGEPSDQVTALRILLDHSNFTKQATDDTPNLLASAEETRKGQAELSSSLGENVRRAVEILIRQSAPSINALVEDEGADRDAVTPNDVYIAACRLVMRCVVILFAEARGDLLPRENPLYNEGYSLQSLREYLTRMAGGHGDERLRNSHAAWPRMVALFQLIYHGSEHEKLPIPAYGGGLFTPGDYDSADPIVRAIAAFEDPKNDPNDSAVHRILKLLGTARVKVRQGNRNTWVNAPVNFSDLSSEYIGILYEGLLDYELRRVPENEPMVMLNIGAEPVLPFERLRYMTQDALAELLKELSDSSSAKLGSDDGLVDEDTYDEPEEIDEQSDDDVDEEDELDVDETEGMVEKQYRELIFEWAKKAVVTAGIAKPPRGATEPEEWTIDFVEEVDKKARRLTPDRNVYFPGQWYLVRWGGTRKGSGTYYTRPQLAVPTTQRTLRPLAYDPVMTEVDEETGLENVTEWAPKKPREILKLKVCDPAMGSGSFLVGALRFLTDALTESFFYHGLLDQKGSNTIPRLADGKPFADFSEDPIPVPLDNPLLEERLRGRLKRYVVERCIYGVDIDPLAVELARLAMWVETMDKDQPFGFLDHKLKCGNSLIGAWTDRVFDYPAVALEHYSDAGDKNHKGVHFKKRAYSNAIKEARNYTLKPALRRAISSRSAGALGFFEDDTDPEEVHGEATARFEALHDIPIFETKKRKEAYGALQDDENFRRLKLAYDSWCAIWFWEPDPVELEDDKYGWEVCDLPTAEDYLNPDGETQRRIERLSQRHRFFHWELEFPDVFTPRRRGFDAILGNPPWEIAKANSKEFFSNIDPLYRSYGKQEALKKQKQYFRKDRRVEQQWIDYNATYKAQSNWVSNVAYPYGDGKFTEKGESFMMMEYGGQWRESDKLHRQWTTHREDRPEGFADPEHPFRHQGSSDLNTYKMFLEFGHALLAGNGRLGMIVPSGIYSDKGSTDLRQLFLRRSRWEWLFGFENRDKIFDIHRSFKFCSVIIEKGGETDVIRAAFMRHDLNDWENGEEHAIAYPRDRVEQFSPNTQAILELQTSRDLEILEKIYSNSVLLGDESEDGWGIKYATEFHMTNDSELFPPRPEWEAKGYEPDEYGHWLKGDWRPVEDFGFREDKSLLDPQYKHWSILDRPDGVVLSRDGTHAMALEELEDVALPLYEGRMIGQFDFSEKGWVSGKGRSANWRSIPFHRKVVEPQYLISREDVANNDVTQPKIGYMRISSSTNSRTTISSFLRGFPAGDSVFFFKPQQQKLRTSLLVSGIFNSFAYDYQVRYRLGGLNMSEFVMVETALPKVDRLGGFEKIALRLAGVAPRFAPEWNTLNLDVVKSWRSLWGITAHERLRLRIVCDLIVARAFGLGLEEIRWLLTGCDFSSDYYSSLQAKRELSRKGFWRVDKNLIPALRQTVLTIVAMAQTKDWEIAALENWQIPHKLRLSEYGLGHRGRASKTEEVASHFGPRLYGWQTKQAVNESWQECRRHAELIRQIVPPEPIVEREKESVPSDDSQGVLL